MSPAARDARDTIAELNKTKNVSRRAGYGCTVVSLLPLTLHEEKPHMLPSTYRIPSAGKEGIGILIVGEGVHYIPHPIDNYSIKQITPPHEMARSVVDDWKTAQIALGEGAEPGLFWVEGIYDEDEIRANFPDLIEEAEAKQKLWFRNLVGLADGDWNKNHNIMAVSDLQRMAAKSLGIKKDWVDFLPSETIACPYCKTQVSPDAVKCMNCNEVINAVAYKAMKASLEGVQTND